jgi:hypothetical protein
MAARYNFDRLLSSLIEKQSSTYKRVFFDHVTGCKPTAGPEQDTRACGRVCATTEAQQ